MISLTPLSVRAGESALTVTYQPLDGLGSGEIIISAVSCHDWYAGSGQATAIQLISARNVPPTNNPKEAVDDLNIASACRLVFNASDLGDPDAKPELTLDASQFVVPARYDHPKEDILRASLECLRRCLPAKLRSTPLTFTAAKKDKAWIEPIVKQFNSHNRAKVYFTPPKG